MPRPPLSPARLGAHAPSAVPESARSCRAEDGVRHDGQLQDCTRERAAPRTRRLAEPHALIVDDGHRASAPDAPGVSENVEPPWVIATAAEVRMPKVTGVPSDHRASGCTRTVTAAPSGAMSQLCAIAG